MNPYSKTITPTEKKLGFQKIKIDSGYQGFAGPEIWEAWAYKITKSDYFFKMGEKQYKQMHYGHRLKSKIKKIEWHPIGDGYEIDPTGLPKLTLEDEDFLIIVGIEYSAV